MPNNKLYTFKELLSSGIKNSSDNMSIVLDKIFIPTIQRPYAQGRASSSDIRENFIRDLFKALRTPSKPYELNFVFGSLIQDNSGNSFELLDGQQRLTTLLLLHWYLALRSIEDVESVLSLLSKFSYQTRTTSILFLNKLFKNPIDVVEKPSDAILKQPWYTTAFSKDSTVIGMLVMLDEIHRRYELEIYEGYMPTYENLGCLKFYMQELKGFGISDDLFIKMNARGLQLTPFENFKAELIGWLKNDPFNDNRYDQTITFGESSMPFWLAFSSKIDTLWMDIFWNKTNIEDSSNLGATNADESFFMFLKRWLANRALTLSVQTNDSEFDDFHAYFNEKINVNKYSSFEKTHDFLEKAFSFNIDIIEEIAHLLDMFSRRHDEIFDAFRAPWQSTCQLPMDKKFELRPMIIFSAISEFISSSQDDFDTIEFQHWMRIVHNIVQNQDINGASRQQTLTKQLKRAIDFDKSLDIYNRFKAFNQNQHNREFDAEVLKINRIFDDKNWEDTFKEAEKNLFMTGSVTFYLDENTDLQTFKNRTSHVDLIFDKDGIKGEFAKQYLLIRAIVACDSSLFMQDRDSINFTNKESGTRYLKNLTIWNNAPNIRRLWRSLLDLPDTESMSKLLLSIIFSESTPVEMPGCNEKTLEALNLGISRFCKEENVKPIAWLENAIKEPDKKLRYNKNNGLVYFYKGYVNCLYLNSYREEFLPPVIVILTKHDFDILFWDNRQPATYSQYGLYSGERIWIKASKDNLKYVFRFDCNFCAQIYLEISSPVENFPEFTINNLPVGVEKTIPDEQDCEVWGNELFYRIMRIDDIRNVDPNELSECLSNFKHPIYEPLI